MNRFRALIRSMMTTDLRSLALFRICLGSVLIIDLIDRLVDARMYYTDSGTLPRDLMVTHADFHRFAVFHLMNGALWFQYALFAVHLVFALFFVLGFRTRLSSIVVWALTLSLQSRDIQVGYCVDIILRMGLLWGAFLPLGERFSLDRALDRSAPQGSNRYSAPAVLGLFLLLVSVYLFTAILKAQNAAWADGLGTYYAFSLDEYAMPLAKWLVRDPALLKLMSHSTLAIEAFGWLPLFIPWKKEWLRLPLFIFFASFHVVMGLFLNVTLFQFAAVATWTCVLPEAFWDYAHRYFREMGSNVVLRWRKRIEKFQSHYRLSGERVGVNVKHPALWNGLACVIIAICLYWNVRESDAQDFPMFAPLENVSMAFGLDQRWDMFATAAADSGWFVIPAMLADGSEVDLFRDGALLDWTKPEQVYTQFRDERMRKMMLRVAGFNNDPFRMAYANYLCRSWNNDHGNPGKRLEAFKIILMQQMILLNGEKSPPKRLMLWRQECGDGLLDKWKSQLEEAG